MARPSVAHLGGAVLAGALAVGAAGACTRVSHPTVERFDVTIRLEHDGLADVREEIAVRSAEAPLSYFDRTVAARRVDRLEFVSASIDGADVRPGPTGKVTVEVATARALRVLWRLPPTASSTHVLGLRYKATGALAVQAGRGRFEWPAIPAGRPYPVLASRVVLTLPASSVLYDLSGIAEAGWRVEWLPHGLAAERAGLDSSEGATGLADLSVDPALVGEPRWQQDADFGRQLTPAFISGGLFILVIGAGVLWIIRFEGASHAAGGQPEAERRATARALYAAGLVCVVFALALTAVVHLTLGRMGMWPMVMPASIMAVGLVFVGVGAVGRRVSRNPAAAVDSEPGARQ